VDQKIGRTALFCLIAFFLFSACGTPGPAVPANPENPETLAAQTWSVIQTSAALTGTPTAVPQTSTNTSAPKIEATITNTATPTQTPVPMLTALPTLTPQPTATVTKVPTATPWYYYPGGGVIPPPGYRVTPVYAIPCLAAELVRDVTIPNGTNLPRNTDFVKVWRIENTGSCTWDTKLYFAPVGYVGGSPRIDPFGGAPVQIGEKVRPGKTIDIALSLTTPDKDGSFRSQWVFTDKENFFGNKGDTKPFVFTINVQQTLPNPIFDFTLNACLATWTSNARFVKTQSRLAEGTSSLPCNGKPNNPVGFVRRVNEPVTESGTATGLSGIWENPPFINGGIAQGVFPALLVLPGDKFSAYVGCLDGNTECNVTFALKYRVINLPYAVVEEGSITRDQVYDGSIGSLEVDLSSLGLVGKYVEFVLSVRANSESRQNAAVWISPAIIH
jgi:hypothetical protein